MSGIRKNQLCWMPCKYIWFMSGILKEMHPFVQQMELGQTGFHGLSHITVQSKCLAHAWINKALALHCNFPAVLAFVNSVCKNVLNDWKIIFILWYTTGINVQICWQTYIQWCWISIVITVIYKIYHTVISTSLAVPQTVYSPCSSKQTDNKGHISV